ncbi:MAG: hypothetical protein JWN30_1366 [Bacilli bacterium]|nr:hypothetical protein [Bacilli bacterium]
MIKNLIKGNVEHNEIVKTIADLKDTFGFSSTDEAIEQTNRIIRSFEEPKTTIV